MLERNDQRRNKRPRLAEKKDGFVLLLVDERSEEAEDVEREDDRL